MRPAISQPAELVDIVAFKKNHAINGDPATWSEGFTHRCVACPAPVPNRGTYCPECAERESRELRRHVLRRLLESLPDVTGRTADPRLTKACVEWSHGRKVTKDGLPDSRSMMLLGTSGAGKTTAVATMLRARAEAAIARDISTEKVKLLARTRWVRSEDLVDALKQHPLGDRKEAPLVRACRTAPLLVIDDFGHEPLNDMTRSAFVELIARRHDNHVQLPTITTTGLTPQAVRDRYGDAVWRKLTIGGFVSVHQEAA